LIVTGNKRHFPGDQYGVTAVVNAGKLVEFEERRRVLGD
jgi:hypothetical protein